MLRLFKSYQTEKSLKKHDKLCKNHEYCKVSLRIKENNILQHLSETKSMKMPHVIYVDTKSLLIKHNKCSNNPNNFFTENLATHIACRYSLTLTKSYNNVNIHSFYRGEHCIPKLCEELLKQSTKIFNIEIPLTTDEQTNHDKTTVCHICNKGFTTDETHNQYINYRKVID